MGTMETMLTSNMTIFAKFDFNTSRVLIGAAVEQITCHLLFVIGSFHLIYKDSRPMTRV